MRTLALAAILLCLPRAATAQEPTRVEVESALTRMLWAEASVGQRGERDRTVMLFAIHQLDKHERRSSNILETLGYHIPWWNRGAPPNRPWIAGITTACTEPAGFKRDWDVYRHYCYRLVGRVRDYYAGRLRNPCKGTPNNWRKRGKWSRKAKRNHYHVGCGRTLHNYFDTHRLPNGRVPGHIKRRNRNENPTGNISRRRLRLRDSRRARDSS